MPNTAENVQDVTAANLALELAAANRAYYDGGQPMPDAYYDQLKEMLRAADPTHPLLREVGAPVNPKSALKKVRHRIPMGSLDNAFEEVDIRQFLKRVDKLLAEAQRSSCTALVVQPKMDGFSIDLCYEAGVLAQAITRGDGVEGEDVTHNMMKARGVPLTLSERVDMSVRGEVVIHRKAFAKHFAGEANTRSSAAGTARRLDGARAQHLQFYAFSAVNHDGSAPAKTEQKLVERLNALGLRTAPSELISSDDSDDLAAQLLALWQLWSVKRADMPFDCDGAVAKVSNVAKSTACGTNESTGCPRGMLAMKWRGSMVATAKVVGVENSIGRTGAITPVAILDPVECGGVKISRVSLANWDEVARLGVGHGAFVLVERAGEVIPKVTKVLTPGAAVFQRPNNCPSCDHVTVADGPRQLCLWPDCPGKAFRKVYHWVTQRAIMHLGEAAVDALMALDGPVQRAADLYTVDEKALTAACGGAVMARKVAASLEASRDITLPDLLGSIGVPGLGTTDALKLCRGLGLRAVSDVQSPNGPYVFDRDGIPMFDASQIALVPGFAAEKAAKVHAGLVAWTDDILALSKHMRVTPPPDAANAKGPLAGQKFCITGPTELPRPVLKKIMADAGGEWHSSVVRGLHLLVMAESDSQSIKAKAARAQGVRTISEREALDLAGYGG